jgi:hypothetical protein
MTDTTTAATIHPCPDCCTEPAGHGYDSLVRGDNLSRTHCRMGEDLHVGGIEGAAAHSPMLLAVPG